jgi:capsular exopolysaccharide synthesis family protein
MTTPMPAPEPRPTIAADLRGLLVAVRRRIGTVLAVTALVLGVSIVLTQRQTPEYTSHARALVLPVAAENSPLYFFRPINMETERGLVSSSAVAALVQEGLATDESVESLLSGLRVSVERDTEILDVGYADREPARAQRLAQAFTESYLGFREGQAIRQIEARTEEIERAIEGVSLEAAALSAELAGEADPVAAQALQAQLEIQEARLTALQRDLIRVTNNSQVRSAGEIVQPATLPATPSTAGYLQNGAFALFLGLSLGVALALVRDRLDDRIKGREDLEEASGLPVLAVVPRVAQWRDRRTSILAMGDLPTSAAAEAYRALRTAILFVSTQRDLRLVLITSPQMGDGKTTTSANLAVALGHAGKRVVLVSGDLRQPRVHEFFTGVTNEYGIVDVLADEMSLAEAVQETEFPNVKVLACGSSTPHVAEMVHIPSMNRLLADLRDLADVVLIDSAPVLAVSDTIAIASEVDGVVLVTQSHSAERRAIKLARELLDQVDAPLIGAVLNSHDPARGRGYAYRYVGDTGAVVYGAEQEGNGAAGRRADGQARPTVAARTSPSSPRSRSGSSGSPRT